MPTFQFKSRPRLPALLLLTIGLAQFAAPAASSIEVEIHGVDETMQPNVLAYLSFGRYKNSKDLTPEFVDRLQERVEREVRAALRPFGFYEPAVKSQVKREPGSEPRYLVTIDVVTGKPVVVDEVNVTITGPGATDSKFTDITNNLSIRTGQRLNHAQYDELKGRLLRTAATFGYHDSRMTRSEMRVDPAAYSADIEIAFETGPQYRFGPTTLSQDVVEDSLVRRFLRYQQDQPFDATELLRTQFALDDSQYFSTVEVLPGERDRENLTVPISITAEPNRRNRYQYGVGYGTDTEIRGTASWENRRVNERGHRFRTEVKAAALEQSLDARYIVPIGDPATEKFTMQLKGEHARLADIDDKSINFLPSLTHLTDSWFGDQQRWQRVSYVELLNTDSEFVASGRRDQQTLLIPGVSFALVPPAYLGEALFSRTLYAELRGSHNTLGSDSDFLQVRVQAERVFDFAGKWHVLLRGDIGATALSETSALAPSQRFFAGGDRSVRGFGINDLSPVQQVFAADGVTPVRDNDGDITFEKVGGKHLFAGSVELIRDLPRNFAVAVFADAGNAFDNFGDPLMYSVGIGMRLRLPVVSVGIDVAQALTIPAGNSDRPSPRLHLNFSPKL
ncbi:MAG: BamA/TamA family outer membrane protein [Steroidobacteraceae bacterium]|nr:BamA/TamA family outer membrane protein [Steroidobacteraceae bacterium]